MDSDFEEGELHLPQNLLLQSQQAQEETQAAKELGPLVESLCSLLMARPFQPTPQVLTAVALVDASCRGSGPFYASQTWDHCKDHRQHFQGRSFRDMRALARSCLDDLEINL